MKPRPPVTRQDAPRKASRAGGSVSAMAERQAGSPGRLSVACGRRRPRPPRVPARMTDEGTPAVRLRVLAVEAGVVGLIAIVIACRAAVGVERALARAVRLRRRRHVLRDGRQDHRPLRDVPAQPAPRLAVRAEPGRLPGRRRQPQLVRARRRPVADRLGVHGHEPLLPGVVRCGGRRRPRRAARARRAAAAGRRGGVALRLPAVPLRPQRDPPPAVDVLHGAVRGAHRAAPALRRTAAHADAPRTAVGSSRGGRAGRGSCSSPSPCWRRAARTTSCSPCCCSPWPPSPGP